VDYPPKKLAVRILEFAGLFALSAFLIKLGVRYILEVWPVLLVIVIVSVGVAVGIRIWKNRPRW